MASAPGTDRGPLPEPIVAHPPSTAARRRSAAGLVAAVIGALVVTVSVLVGAPSAPSSARQGPASDCPAMTDSIRRLHLAYFNREPSGAEFTRWTTAYRTGGFNLEQIGQALSETTEFRERYGAMDDTRFVELVYRNTLRREPDAERLQHWTDSLAGGHSRGALMVAFSESEEFVDRTDTAPPLAGYLKWYPRGVHWYCGAGPRDDLSIVPLAGDGIHADLLFHNGGAAATDFALYTVEEGDRNARMTTGSLAAGHTQFNWDGDFEGDGFYGAELDIIASNRTSWIVVFYTGSIGSERLGWQIEPSRS